jgi:hypothetical protein
MVEAGTALILPCPGERFPTQLSELYDTGTEEEAKRGRKSW